MYRTDVCAAASLLPCKPNPVGMRPVIRGPTAHPSKPQIQAMLLYRASWDCPQSWCPGCLLHVGFLAPVLLEGETGCARRLGSTCYNSVPGCPRGCSMAVALLIMRLLACTGVLAAAAAFRFSLLHRAGLTVCIIIACILACFCSMLMRPECTANRGCSPTVHCRARTDD